MVGTGTAHLRRDEDAVLRVLDLTVEYAHPSGRPVQAVSGVNFDILRGETLGMVGESGCGKSSVAKAAMQLPPPTAGQVWLGDEELTSMSGKELRRARSHLQMIYQDPISSLNPRRTVFKAVSQGLEIQGRKSEASERVPAMLTAVGLDSEAVGSRRPHELSGGQCQRVSLARALIMDPYVVICDEPVSALDVSIQGQILNLLRDLKETYGISLLFITHDLAVVKNTSDRIAVMYLGRLCEIGPTDEITERPLHPYTAALLAAVADPDSPKQADMSEAPLGGEVPSPLDPPSGCRFRTRCPAASDICRREEPMIEEVGPGHFVACHFPLI